VTSTENKHKQIYAESVEKYQAKQTEMESKLQDIMQKYERLQQVVSRQIQCNLLQEYTQCSSELQTSKHIASSLEGELSKRKSDFTAKEISMSIPLNCHFMLTSTTEALYDDHIRAEKADKERVQLQLRQEVDSLHKQLKSLTMQKVP
jgi:hypothetical protein